MDREQFRHLAELDQLLADYLDEVAQAAGREQADRAAGLALLFGVAAYGLYRMAKNYFDHERGLDEAELRQEMLHEVEILVQNGWKRDKALDAVLTVSKDVAGLRRDSPAIKSAIAILKEGVAATGG